MLYTVLCGTNFAVIYGLVSYYNNELVPIYIDNVLGKVLQRVVFERSSFEAILRRHPLKFFSFIFWHFFQRHIFKVETQSPTFA